MENKTYPTSSNKRNRQETLHRNVNNPSVGIRLTEKYPKKSVKSNSLDILSNSMEVKK